MHLAGDLDEPPFSDMKLQLYTRRPLENMPVTQHAVYPSEVMLFVQTATQTSPTAV